jgi:hypothetical protein
LTCVHYYAIFGGAGPNDRSSVVDQNNWCHEEHIHRGDWSKKIPLDWFQVENMVLNIVQWYWIDIRYFIFGMKRTTWGKVCVLIVTTCWRHAPHCSVVVLDAAIWPKRHVQGNNFLAIMQDQKNLQASSNKIKIRCNKHEHIQVEVQQNVLYN